MADGERRIREAVQRHLQGLTGGPHTPAVTDNLDLFDSGLLDSYAFIEMLAELESRLGLTIDLSEADPADFATVAGLARCLARGAATA